MFNLDLATDAKSALRLGSHSDSSVATSMCSLRTPRLMAGVTPRWVSRTLLLVPISAASTAFDPATVHRGTAP